MKHLTILGSTGSIGCSTLDVIRHNPDEFSVTALVAGKNVARMVEQCLEFRPRFAVMDDEASAAALRAALREQGSQTEVLAGRDAACEMAALDEVTQVMAAIVGAPGFCRRLRPSPQVSKCYWRIKSRWSPAGDCLWTPWPAAARSCCR